MGYADRTSAIHSSCGETAELDNDDATDVSADDALVD